MNLKMTNKLVKKLYYPNSQTIVKDDKIIITQLQSKTIFKLKH